MDKPKRILIVDDVEQNRELLEGILTSLGHEAETARDGVEALAKLKLDIDLVLMDVQLPGIDGLEATRRIRESEADEKVPIVALSSYAMTGDREKALNAGCTGYLEKPINPETFMDSIEKYL